VTRRNGFGSITKLPSRRYRARYTVPGSTPQVWINAPETFARKDEAELWLARQRTAIEDGRVRPRAQASKVTLREYADEWLDTRTSAAGEPLRPSTRRVYVHYLDKHVYPVLGDVRLPQLTGEKIAAWYRATLVGRPTLRARTYSLLRTILTTAVEDGHLAENPCRIRGASRARPATPTTVATPAQVVELAAAMPDRLALAVLLGAWCQLRNGEVLELRRGDVTPERVKISRGVTWVARQPHVGPPKTDASVRTVSVPPHVAQVITDHLATHVARGATALLFPAAPGGATQMHPSTFAYFFKQAVRRTSLPPEFRFHWLRHTGLTLAAQSGATLAELQARAGHSTASTVMLYQHATSLRDQALARALSTLATEQREDLSATPAGA
jgi:integrase